MTGCWLSQLSGGALSDDERMRMADAARAGRPVGQSTTRFFEAPYELKTGRPGDSVKGLEDRMCVDRARYYDRISRGVDGIEEEAREFAEADPAAGGPVRRFPAEIGNVLCFLSIFSRRSAVSVVLRVLCPLYSTTAATPARHKSGTAGVGRRDPSTVLGVSAQPFVLSHVLFPFESRHRPFSRHGMCRSCGSEPRAGRGRFRIRWGSGSGRHIPNELTGPLLLRCQR